MWEHALLSVSEMARADAAAAVTGMPTRALMENAGAAVAREVRRRWPPQPVVVLCGPGNNGGDGFVAARLLKDIGWPVRVALLGTRESLKGDAAANAARWSGPVEPLAPPVLSDAGIVIDAIFGAGLTRPIEGAAAATIVAVEQRALPCVAVDIPSGVHGDSGAVLGAAPRARVTVTFFRRKPGHLLLPGRSYCGETVVAEIGIPESVLEEIRPNISINHPDLWRGQFPRPQPGDNKYTRGHAVIVGGETMTGAARLAAAGARRIGAGLVTIAAPMRAFAIYAAGAPGVIVHPIPTGDRGDRTFRSYLADVRRNAVLIGPGAGVTTETRRRVLVALKAGKATVLDADAITVFAGKRKELKAALNERCVLTPHDGEYARLFIHEGDRLARVRAAAKEIGAVVLIKGADTVVAAPDGRAVINADAPPDLATAGSGDVLAGMVLGLLAQGMGTFEAACAAVWMHGVCAAEFGPGLIAEDLPEQIPSILRRIFARLQ